MTEPKTVVLVTDDQRMVMDRDAMMTVPYIRSELIAHESNLVWLDLDRTELSWYLSFLFSSDPAFPIKGHGATVDFMQGQYDRKEPWIEVSVQNRVFKARLSTLKKSHYLGGLAEWNGKVCPRIKLSTDPEAFAHFLSKMRNPERTLSPEFEGYVDTFLLVSEVPKRRPQEEPWTSSSFPGCSTPGGLLGSMSPYTTSSFDSTLNMQPKFNRLTETRLLTSWYPWDTGKSIAFVVDGTEPCTVHGFTLHCLPESRDQRCTLRDISEIRVQIRNKEGDATIIEAYTDPGPAIKMTCGLFFPHRLDTYRRYKRKNQLFVPLFLLSDLRPAGCFPELALEGSLEIELDFKTSYRATLMHRTAIVMDLLEQQRFDTGKFDFFKVGFSGCSVVLDKKTNVVTVPLADCHCTALVFKMNRASRDFGIRKAEILDQTGSVVYSLTEASNELELTNLVDYWDKGMPSPLLK